MGCNSQTCGAIILFVLLFVLFPKIAGNGDLVKCFNGQLIINCFLMSLLLMLHKHSLNHG